MNDEIKKLGLGLKKLSIDLRDFSHHKIFGTISPLNIPNIDFLVSPVQPVILDQGDLNDCTAFGSSELNTHIQDLPIGQYFDPLYQMAKILQIQGEVGATEADLRSAAKSLVMYGSILKNQSPFTHNTGLPTDKDESFLNDWNNWPKILDTFAQKYALGSFLAVDGPYYAFVNISSILWQNCTVSSNGLYSGVLFGLNWRPEWTYADKGIINDNYAVSSGEGHCVLILGQVMINNIPYLKIQNSWGTSAGDNGFYYFPRNVINIEFAAGYGAYTFKNMSATQLGYMLQYSIKNNDPWFVEIFKVIKENLKYILPKI